MQLYGCGNVLKRAEFSHILTPDGMMCNFMHASDMGIDMRLHLVDGAALLNLLQMDWNELISSINDLSLRKSRPKKDTKLNRDFDIDCEAEFLDIAEKFTDTGSVREVLAINYSHDALLKLVEWASVGYWEAWEGRCILYLENALGRELDNVDDMYSPEIWDEVGTALCSMSESEYSERVCADWMERRKELGETLDDKKDPRIIPTFEAHDRNSRLLHYAVNENKFVQLLGRDHLESRLWGHGEWNLSNLLDS
tara:strand:+ start:871 stop:1629 length:759 start_codon:yes stop_codon:yes gene_type:complete